MHMKLISFVVAFTFLFVVPVFGQEPGAQPTYRGRVSGESGRIRADFGAYLALQTVPVGTGLEVANFQNIKLRVADVPVNLREIGLTQDRIRGTDSSRRAGCVRDRRLAEQPLPHAPGRVGAGRHPRRANS